MSDERYWCGVHPQSAAYVRTITFPDGRAITGQCCSVCCDPIDPVMAKLVAGVAKEPPVIRTFAVYREHASRTDGSHPIMYYAGGLCEEAGEIWGVLKKHWYHGHEFNSDKVREELGDALEPLDQLAKHLGYTLEECAGANVAKLQKRYGEKFSEEASRNREEGT